MATRTLDLAFDVQQPAFSVDLDPQLYDMELSFAEIDVAQNDTVTIAFAITEGGNPFDLTGYAVTYNAKVTPQDSSYVFSKSGTLVDAANGKCQVVLAASDLATAGNFVTQLYLTMSGLTTSVAQFPLIVQASV